MKKKTSSSIKDNASLNQLDKDSLNQELKNAKKEILDHLTAIHFKTHLWVFLYFVLLGCNIVLKAY